MATVPNSVETTAVFSTWQWGPAAKRFMKWTLPCLPGIVIGYFYFERSSAVPTIWSAIATVLGIVAFTIVYWSGLIVLETVSNLHERVGQLERELGELRARQ